MLEQVSRGLGEKGGVGNLGTSDFLQNHLLIASLERTPSHHQFIGQDSQGPIVRLFIITLPAGHFWGNIVQSAAEGISLLIELDGPSEVCDFVDSVLLQNVFEFQVSVQNALFLQVEQSLDEIS